MERKELQEFIYFLTRSKQLSRAQQRRRDSLLARDFFASTEKRPAINKSGALDVGQCLLHNTTIIVNFLHQFTESGSLALKYTTHLWDKNNETGEYPYHNFSEFKESYLKILNDKEARPLENIRSLCMHLWQIISNFLINDEPKYPWSEFKLKIGYNKYLKEWMDANPNVQPFSMPISAFPKEIQPKRINGKTLIYFNDVVDVFKHCIEFRDNDLYYSTKQIFSENPDFKLNQVLLETLKGRSIYTDTELVKDAMRIIAHNIFPRSEFPKLEISANLVNDEVGQRIILKILQLDSYSEKDILDPKIVAVVGDGDINRIKSKLINLCDFSIESRFRINGVSTPCRINYLSSNSDNMDKVNLIDESMCRGFAYILTFYIGNHV